MYPTLSSRYLFLSALVALALGLAACSSGNAASTNSPESPPPGFATPADQAPSAPSPGSPTPSTNQPAPQTSNQTPNAPQVQSGSLTPDGNRVYADVKFLSLAPRPAGTEQEKDAANFLADRLRKAGYEVSFQEFPVQVEAREASLVSSGSGGRKIVAIPLERSASATLQGQLLPSGIGRPNEFPASLRGKIALIQRGELTFNDKVLNAQAAGAIGAIIYNNNSGDVFNGSLAVAASIPVLAISEASGRDLLAAIEKGRVDVDLKVGDNGRAMSRNVIAKPPGRDCETVTGGHYDSVPIAPGASDNGTGTATVIEIASVLASKGAMGSNCFVLFGAEEIGLVGSRYFVDSLSPVAKSHIKAMYNFDMVGVGSEGWLFIGDANLQRQAQSVGARLGVSGSLSQLSTGASSDHASFNQAGIPAFMLHRTRDSMLHTPQDTIDRVRPELLEQAAKLGVALLESANAGG